MIVKNCDKCGKQIHVGQFLENKCMFCHSPVKFKEPEGKVSQTVNECEEQLAKGNLVSKAGDIVGFYDRYIDKYPDVSALYWGRLLARYSLKSDFQLLSSGIRFIDDEDYMAAYNCGSDEEKMYFDSIIVIYNTLLQKVIKEARKRKKSEITTTDIRKKQEEIYEQLKDLSDIFLAKMQEFCRVEAQLKNQVTDCEVQYDCFRSMADSALNGISNLKSDIGQKTEISDLKAFEYRLLMSRYLKVSEDVLKKTKDFESSEMFKNYNLLLKHRESLRTVLLNLIDEIVSLDNSMKELLTTVENIKSRYDKAIEQAKTQDFSRMASVFEDDTIEKLLDEIMKH